MIHEWTETQKIDVFVSMCDNEETIRNSVLLIARTCPNVVFASKAWCLECISVDAVVPIDETKGHYNQILSTFKREIMEPHVAMFPLGSHTITWDDNLARGNLFSFLMYTRNLSSFIFNTQIHDDAIVYPGVDPQI